MCVVSSFSHCRNVGQLKRGLEQAPIASTRKVRGHTNKTTFFLEHQVHRLNTLHMMLSVLEGGKGFRASLNSTTTYSKLSRLYRTIIGKTLFCVPIIVQSFQGCTNISHENVSMHVCVCAWYSSVIVVSLLWFIWHLFRSDSDSNKGKDLHERDLLEAVCLQLSPFNFS